VTFTLLHGISQLFSGCQIATLDIGVKCSV
jgi:hypothetical protein